MVPQRKRGRPRGSTDLRPRKRRASKDPLHIDTENPSHDIVSDYTYVLETLELAMGDAPAPTFVAENIEISMSGNNPLELLDRASTHIDDVFAYSVALELIEHDDIEPRSVRECERRADWPKWKEAIQVELDSLTKRQVFGPVVLTPPSVKPVGHKWVFVRKRNERNEILRYKARLVAQGFS